MTKTKTKKLKLPLFSSLKEWVEYMTHMVESQREQIERKDAQIAALERKIDKLENKIKAYEDHDNLRQAGNRY